MGETKKNFKKNGTNVAHKNIVANEEQLKAIADTAIDAFISIDNKSNIIFWNKAAKKTFGYTKDEIIGCNVTSLMPKRFRLKHRRGVKRFIKTHKSHYLGRNIELVALRRDGSEFPIELTVSTWKTKNKEYFTAIVRDITERKQMEVKLEKAYRAEHRITYALQKKLLPKKIPKITNIKIATYFKSATMGAEVGGDFYDIFKIDEHNYTIVIGDISGKGVDVATETIIIRNFLRDKALTKCRPSEVLASLNNSLLRLKNKNFIALSYLVYNTNSSILKLINAGNPPPLSTKNSQLLRKTNIPVSILPNVPYSNIVELKLRKNDMVVLYTDGLTEPRYKNKFFGEKRVCIFVKENKHLPPDKLIKNLVIQAREFSHDNLADDIVVLIIKKE